MVVLLLDNCRMNTTVIRQYYNCWTPPYNLQYDYTSATAMQLSYEDYSTLTKLQILYKWWDGVLGVEGGHTAILIQSSYSPRTVLPVLPQYFQSIITRLLQYHYSTTTLQCNAIWTDYSNTFYIV
jgi:hypothetical protein